MALAKGERQTPEYLKLNPNGKVPALRLDDDSVLTESTAIVTYAKNRRLRRTDDFRTRAPRR